YLNFNTLFKYILMNMKENIVKNTNKDWKRLIDCLNLKDEIHYPYLHYGILCPNDVRIDEFKEMVKAEKDLNFRDIFGSTLLMFACENFNMCSKCNNCINCLNCSIYPNNKCIEFIKILLQHGADP